MEFGNRQAVTSIPGVLWGSPGRDVCLNEVYGLNTHCFLWDLRTTKARIHRAVSVKGRGPVSEVNMDSSDDELYRENRDFS